MKKEAHRYVSGKGINESDIREISLNIENLDDESLCKELKYHSQKLESMVLMKMKNAKVVIDENIIKQSELVDKYINEDMRRRNKESDT